MPAAKKNSSLRIIVPIIVLAAAIGIVLALGSNAQNQTRKRTTQNQNAAQVDDTTPSPSGGDETKSPETQSGSEADQPADDQPVPADPEAPEADQPEQPAADGADDGAQPTTDDGVFDGLKARVFGPNPADGIAETLGSPYFDSDYDFEIELTYLGAGIKRILLNKEFETANELVEARERKDAGETNIQVEGQYVLVHMGEMPVVQADGSTVTYRLVPLAAYAMQVGDQTIDLFGGISGQLWRTGDQPGEMVAEIENASGQLVVRVVRTYQVDPDSYDIVVEQRVENLTDRELRFSFIQEGPLDLDRDRAGYSLLSMQRVRYGYTLKNQANWQDPQVKADGRLTRMQSVINEVNKAWSKGLGADSLWPPRKPFSGADELVWIAQTNRYFGMIVHPLLDPSAPADKGFDLIGRVDPILLANSDNDGKGRLSMRITSPEFVAPPASAADLSFGVYAGPLDRREMAAQEDPRIAGLQLSEIVVYNIGGMCAFCTFEWLGNMLLFILHIFHDYIVFDWALSIILLVLVVRTILHPIFKRSQIGIQKFAKDMQRVQPKLKKLQEKYKNDRQKLMQEQQKLFRSEGVSYTGALGCLPMFMQSPIWIALYAMLYL
ncbi:MAG: membrane protein insertase YidC, partial [Phycisphaerales bacterium JB050]